MCSYLLVPLHCITPFALQNAGCVWTVISLTFGDHVETAISRTASQSVSCPAIHALLVRAKIPQNILLHAQTNYLRFQMLAALSTDVPFSWIAVRYLKATVVRFGLQTPYLPLHPFLVPTVLHTTYPLLNSMRV